MFNFVMCSVLHGTVCLLFLRFLRWLNENDFCFHFQTGFSGNIIILSVFYYGGIMMSEAQITVGELSSFLLYAAFVGVSIGGGSLSYFFIILFVMFTKQFGNITWKSLLWLSQLIIDIIFRFYFPKFMFEYVISVFSLLELYWVIVWIWTFWNWLLIAGEMLCIVLVDCRRFLRMSSGWWFYFLFILGLKLKVAFLKHNILVFLPGLEKLTNWF